MPERPSHSIDKYHRSFSPVLVLEERWKLERVPTVLNPEDGQQEAIDDKHEHAPTDDHDLLELALLDARSPDGQVDGRERQDTVCESMLASDDYWVISMTYTGRR